MSVGGSLHRWGLLRGLGLWLLLMLATSHRSCLRGGIGGWRHIGPHCLILPLLYVLLERLGVLLKRLFLYLNFLVSSEEKLLLLGGSLEFELIRYRSLLLTQYLKLLNDERELFLGALYTGRRWSAGYLTARYRLLLYRSLLQHRLGRRFPTDRPPHFGHLLLSPPFFLYESPLEFFPLG